MTKMFTLADLLKDQENATQKGHSAWSNIEFFEVLFNQSLLARSQAGPVSGGQWPNPEGYVRALAKDGFWLSPVVMAFLDALLDECDTERRRVIWHTSHWESATHMHQLAINTQKKLPLVSKHFVSWGIYAATQALCSSLCFQEPFTVTRDLDTKYQFSHYQGNAMFERITLRSNETS